MIELKNASEVLSKKSHNLYEELKQLIEILSLQHWIFQWLGFTILKDYMLPSGLSTC